MRPLRIVPLFCCVSICASAQPFALDGLPPYQPKHAVHGVIRSWGHGFLKPLMAYWEDGFRKYQPEARFEDQLFSSAAAMASLYTGRADLGVLAREITPPEMAAYRKFAQQDAIPIDVLTGSCGDPDKIMALAIFVPKDCPIDRLTFAQLDGVFGAEHRRAARNLRTWGDLGATGAWANRRIHPYAGPVGEAPAYFFSQTVMRGAGLWNEDLRQYDDVTLPDGGTQDGYRRVIDAAGSDPDAMALTGAGYRNPNLKTVAIATRDTAPYVEPTPQRIFERTYPLSRPVRFYVNAGPALPPDPDTLEFLRYIVSREGQECVAREGVFLPLNPRAAAASLEAVDRLQAMAPDIPDDAGLRLVATIPMKAMTGTWDHLASDAATGRLFLSAQDDQQVDVVDLDAHRSVRRIGGIFHRPQGELYLPGIDRLAVTNGRDGTCELLDGRTYALMAKIQLSMGADMMAYDSASGLLYAESGGKDSNRGPGRLTIINPVTGVALGDIVTDYRAAALALERGSPRLYAALPGADAVAVIDRTTRRIVARIVVPGRPASLALDEVDHRLFVTTRTLPGHPEPARLYVFDTESGNAVAELPSTDATEDLFYDGAHRRIYSSSLEGPVMVYRQQSADHYEVAAKIPAIPHAGTSEFIPDLHLLCVALPPHNRNPAQVWVFDCRSGG